MEYITLPDLTNPYPQPGNYIKTAPDDVTLFGLYPDINTYLFTLDDLSEVTPVPDTDFRFILSVSNDENDVLDPKLFTSQAYYDDLLLAYDEGNPYFINYSFNEVFIVNVYLQRFLNTFHPLKDFESPYGIHVKWNIFITDEKEVMYEKLVQYINWLVSPAELSEVDTDGVIPYYEISNFTGGKFNTDTLTWGDENTVIKEMRMKDILDELNAVNNDIREIEMFLKNPGTVNIEKLPYALANSVGSLGTAALAAAVVILGPVGVAGIAISVGLASLVTGVSNFISGLSGANQAKKKAEQDLIKYINYLRNELTRLRNRKTELERELLSLESE
jgi:hypothetical protein